jgi:hypothetical protein
LIGTCLVVAAAAYWLSPASPAQAQCGSQASSCKNCHEVQGQDPVNAKGDWHISHAFGDFCQFCHAGNVQATDKAVAHAGMVQPLDDIQTNCASCHPADTADKAKVYAAALGVTIGGGGGPAAGGGPTQPPAAPQPTAAAPAVATQAPVEMGGAGLIDYNAQYAETVEGKVSVNWGNVILGAMVALMAIGGGGFVLWNERRLRRAARPETRGAAAVAEAAQLPTVGAIAPDVLALLPKLQALNPLGRHALARLLADPEAASDLLYRLSKLDPALVEQVRGLDRDARSLLMAMAGH